MESNEFNKSLFSTVEDFLSPPSPTPVKFNKDDVIDLEMPCLFFLEFSRTCLSRGQPSGAQMVMENIRGISRSGG